MFVGRHSVAAAWLIKTIAAGPCRPFFFATCRLQCTTFFIHVMPFNFRPINHYYTAGFAKRTLKKNVGQKCVVGVGKTKLQVNRNDRFQSHASTFSYIIVGNATHFFSSPWLFLNVFQTWVSEGLPTIKVAHTLSHPGTFKKDQRD